MNRHVCTKCKKKRLEKYLKTVRESDREGSMVWICKDGCLDGRMNKSALAYLQQLKSNGSNGLSDVDLALSSQNSESSFLQGGLSDVPGGKFILDVCCGYRKFWFDKNNKNVIFADVKSDVKTDIIQDFRNIKFKDKSFKLVVFDPPHIFKKEGSYSWINKNYGTLANDGWSEDIKKGFDECFRVLEDFGILIFKWNEGSISVSTILNLCPVQPLFGHTSDKRNKTHWLCFMKMPEVD